MLWVKAPGTMWVHLRGSERALRSGLGTRRVSLLSSSALLNPVGPWDFLALSLKHPRVKVEEFSLVDGRGLSEVGSR